MVMGTIIFHGPCHFPLQRYESTEIGTSFWFSTGTEIMESHKPVIRRLTAGGDGDDYDYAYDYGTVMIMSLDSGLACG